MCDTEISKEGWENNVQVNLHSMDSPFVISLGVAYDPNQWTYEEVSFFAKSQFDRGSLEGLDERVTTIELRLPGLIIRWHDPDCKECGP